MEDVLTDDQSHYEISLTAGQAFVAFVLLLLSLAASFAFGLLIGRGQTDDHLAIRKDTAAVSEVAAAPKRVAPKVAEVTNDDFKAPAPTITEAAPAPVPARAPAPAQGPVFAQLLSTSDQKTAEALAAKLIEGGFTAAYVERTNSDKGTVFRVRVKFPSDADAHAAEAKLKQFSKEVWITK
jgi:hypothetical protein